MSDVQGGPEAAPTVLPSPRREGARGWVSRERHPLGAEDDAPLAADGIFGGGGNEMMLDLSREGEGYVGTASIGVQVT